MPRFIFGWLLPAAMAAAVSAAPAQEPPRPAAAPDPLDARADVPNVLHRSVLSVDRRVVDDAPVPWREANETVRRIGGWRAYAREAAAAQVQTKPSAPAAASPMPASQPDHKH